MVVIQFSAIVPAILVTMWTALTGNPSLVLVVYFLFKCVDAVFLDLWGVTNVPDDTEFLFLHIVIAIFSASLGMMFKAATKTPRVWTVRRDPSIQFAMFITLIISMTFVLLYEVIPTGWNAIVLAVSMASIMSLMWLICHRIVASHEVSGAKYTGVDGPFKNVESSVAWEDTKSVGATTWWLGVVLTIISITNVLQIWITVPVYGDAIVQSIALTLGFIACVCMYMFLNVPKKMHKLTTRHIASYIGKNMRHM